MSRSTVLGKGGRDAAFFLFLALVAVLGFGGSLQYPLAVLRAGGFGAAMLFFWRRRKEPATLFSYPLLVGGFVLLAFGHSFSSVYFWVSFQHALNLALAAVLLAWTVLLFRRDPGKTWNAAFLTVGALALVEVGIALFQRFHGGDLRPRGTFDNANYLSEFLAAASILCCARFLWNGEAGRFRFVEASVGGLFFAAAMFLASSRGVLLASVPAFSLLLVSRFGPRKGGALMAGIGVPALLLLGARAAGRFFSPDLFNYSRWIIWKSALRTFIDHPFGVGLGGFKYYWFANQSPVEGAFRRYGKFADTAHSEYMEILSGLGAVGFLLFLAVLVYPLLLAVRNRQEIPGARKSVAAGAASVLVLSGVHALFNANFHVFGIFFLGAVMLGALLSCLPQDGSPVATLPPWSRLASAAMCGGLLVVSVSMAVGVYSFDRGERLLKAGDLPRAERSFRLAASVDPLRAPYPDALSALNFRYLQRERSMGKDPGKEMGFLREAVRWEENARMLNPREPKYSLRLSSLFLELYRVRREPADVQMALRFADRALRINPYSVETLFHRTKLLLIMGRNAEAVRDLEYAVSVEPNFCRGYAKLAELAGTGILQKANGWSEKAEQCRKKGRNLDLVDYEKWLVESPEK